jgi:AbiJ N-terminal domain 3/Abortive infection C-terminus
MKALEEDYEQYLATVATMLATEGMDEAASLLRSTKLRIEQTGYDNWNGGTTIWTIFLSISPTAYARLTSRRAALEAQINERLKPVVEQFSSDWVSVTIAPAVEPQPEWRETQESVSREIRQNIIDGLNLEKVAWSGRLEEVEFLQRLFDLQSLPSHDARFTDAAGDIWQHRVNNEDWDNDWIYGDPRFNLLKGPTDTFLRFLCEMIHPVVRPDRDEAIKLAQHFNDQLRLANWRLVEQEQIAGRPRFVPERIQALGARSVSRARSVADALDAGWMQKEIQRLENSIERDPALAIGTAKELVETCCKSILTKREVEFSRGVDLPALTKLLTKELQLVPEGIPDEAKGSDTIRLILRNLSSLTQYLAELRGLYGTGHGRDGKHQGLEPRHARLAVGSAVAFIDFVTETHHRRSQPARPKE